MAQLTIVEVPIVDLERSCFGMHGLVAQLHPLEANDTLRSSPVTDISAEGAERECVASFMAGLSEQLGGDGLLVACHSNQQPPEMLFRNGLCQSGTDIERSLLWCAVDALDDRGSQGSNLISVAETHSAGLIITAKLILRNVVITVTSLRRDKRPGSSSAIRGRLARILPIAWPFFRMWSQRKDIAHRLSGAEAALETAGSKTILLDRSGRVMFANSAARSYLAAGRGLSADRGRLTAASLTETLRLNATIEHLCSVPSSSAATPVLAIKRRNMRPLMVTLAAAGDQGESSEQLIVARLFDPEHDTSELIEPVCRYYGLSPSETKLTRCITEGQTLTSAAAAIGVREQTARSYLKQIFLKTETNRQAELAALMLRSAVRLPPHCRTQVF